MAKDPAYVRLHERYARSIIADINEYGSLWSISGNAIKEMPPQEDEPEAYDFVKDLLRKGTLEVASKAEWDEQEENAQELRNAYYGGEANRTASDMAVIQEHEVSNLITKRQRQIRRRRAMTDQELEDEASETPEASEGDEGDQEEVVPDGTPVVPTKPKLTRAGVTPKS